MGNPTRNNVFALLLFCAVCRPTFSAPADSAEPYNLAGEWKVTCVGDIIYEFRMVLTQEGDVFRGSMVRTNGTEVGTRVEGRVDGNGNLNFLRRTGNWKQYYVGKVTQASGGQALRLEGLFGDQGEEKLKWSARLQEAR